MIHLKRVYEPPSKDDGFRILVERLWPRGLSKQRAQLDLWLKDISPSPQLRAWYGHEVTKWEEFQHPLVQDTAALLAGTRAHIRFMRISAGNPAACGGEESRPAGGGRAVVCDAPAPNKAYSLAVSKSGIMTA